MQTKTKIVMNKTRVPGVYPSPTKPGEQVLSFGVPSLDSYLGGGSPLHGITLIESEFPGKFGEALCKCFLAEGSTHGHHLFISSSKISPEMYAADLPTRVKSNDDPLIKEVDDEMKIAWRYKHNPFSSRGDPQQSRRGLKDTKFEFCSSMSAEELGAGSVSYCSPFVGSSLIISRKVFLQQTFENLKKFRVETNPKNVLRVVLSGLEEFFEDCRFMLMLKSLLRQSNASAVINISKANISKNSLWKCEYYSDVVFKISSVVREEEKASLGNIDGLCDIIKLHPRSSIKSADVPLKIGLTFRSKKLNFQDLHLPPEGENTKQREVSETKKPQGSHINKNPDKLTF